MLVYQRVNHMKSHCSIGRSWVWSHCFKRPDLLPLPALDCWLVHLRKNNTSMMTYEMGSYCGIDTTYSYHYTYMIGCMMCMYIYIYIYICKYDYSHIHNP